MPNELLNVLEIKSDVLVGIRLSPKYDMKNVIDRVEINKKAKDQMESIEILCEHLNKWIEKNPKYIEYNVTISVQEKNVDEKWLKIWNRSFMVFKSRILGKIIRGEIDALQT